MRINREIRADKIRVIGEDGSQLGVMTPREAIAMAEQEGKDLVEIAPSAKPPVCKIIDYGKLRYHQAKKEKEGRKAQHQVKVKEIKLKPNIDVHDLQTKIKHAREFLGKGHKVRITCVFRGREMLHMELGEKVIKKFCEDLADCAACELPLKQMGKSLTTVLNPVGKRAKAEPKPVAQGE
ncbi:MAG TPA: translation initiation factor IF-3 [Chlamydiales bacterium]|nr:translation initiation factor IF-3 [Chlamydiales bacterium]